jgi:orotate phosphoribosyltransferase
MHEPWIDLLQASGALQSGHFLLSSGRHSGEYVQCALALRRPADAERLGIVLAETIAASVNAELDCVVSPPLGGLLIGYEVARRLGLPFLFPERCDDGCLALRRGFRLEPGSRVCVVEDVVTTGRTTREVIDLAREAGARPTALGAIIDRSLDHAIAGLPVCSVLRLEIPTYDPAECPLCDAGLPLVQPGSRRAPAKSG